MEKKYKILKKAFFKRDNIKLIPIRVEDKFKIMKWRNQQINLLRQKHPLTIKDQNEYFKNIISKAFDQENPKQILFSFLEKNELIGYGGLVHINWQNMNAEISFLLKTELNSGLYYSKTFSVFLELIEEIAKSIDLHKIYTYGYDLYKERFIPLINKSYIKEATLRQHKKIDETWYDIKIYSKII